MQNINRIKDKNHFTISVFSEKLQQNKTFFHHKNLQEIGSRRNIEQYKKAIIINPHLKLYSMVND